MIFGLLILLLFDLSAIALCIVIHPNKTRSNNGHCSLSPPLLLRLSQRRRRIWALRVARRLAAFFCSFAFDPDLEFRLIGNDDRLILVFAPLETTNHGIAWPRLHPHLVAQRAGHLLHLRRGQPQSTTTLSAHHAGRQHVRRGAVH